MTVALESLQILVFSSGSYDHFTKHKNQQKTIGNLYMQGIQKMAL